MRMKATRAKGLHLLSATAVKHLVRPGWHADGGGLYLEVDAGGRKRWAMRLTVNGRRRDFGLGPLHKVSLLQARERASEYRSKAYRGIDPTAGDLQPVQTPTSAPAASPEPLVNSISFEDATRQVYEQRRTAWSNGKHVDQWINTLIDHAFPLIGTKPVNTIGTPDILAVLTPIWNAKPETARRVRQRLATILDWARAAGYRSGDNPVELIGDALPKHNRVDRHHAALPYADVPRFIAELREGRAEAMTKLAFEFLILTASRTADVRDARCAEINLEAATWTIPGNDTKTGRRMKAGREHVVPLSPRCVQILKEAMDIRTEHVLLFPDAQTGRSMSENRFLVARDALGYSNQRCTPHGFRSSFRDWAAEETAFPPEVVEMALAHAIKNKVEAAYRRGQLLAKRRELMDAWAAHCAPAS